MFSRKLGGAWTNKTLRNDGEEGWGGEEGGDVGGDDNAVMKDWGGRENEDNIDNTTNTNNRHK